MTDPFHRDEYATASQNVRELKARKDELRAQGYPAPEVRALVRKFYRAEHFRHLAGRENLYFVAPSTTRTNKLPLEFARLLRDRYGGTIVHGWAVPLCETKASEKGAFGKLRDPARFEPISEAITRLPRDRHVVLVDDVVTTGETSDALRELLERAGQRVAAVVSLGQSELRKVNARDIERIAEKLGEPRLDHEIAAVLSGRLKHRANYLERTIHHDTRGEVRAYFEREAGRIAAAHAIHPAPDRHLRGNDSMATRLQPSAPREAELSPGDSEATHTFRDGEKQPGARQRQHADRAGELTHSAAPNGIAQAHRETWHFNEGYDVALQRLNQLRADAQAQGLDSAKFLGRAMELLNGSRMKAVFRNATSRDALRFFRGAVSAQQLLQAANEAIGKSEDVVQRAAQPRQSKGLSI